MSSWPEAVQYLLRSYATSNAIRAAILALRDIAQRPLEDEEEYSSRLNKAAIRCGNVHSTDEKITLFIDGLSPAIKSLVARYRERHGHMTYLELVHFAQAEGDAVRAQTRNTRRLEVTEVRRVEPRKTGKPAVVSALHLESPAESGASSLPHQRGERSQVDAVYYLDGAEGSIPTTDLPTTESGQADDLMYADNCRLPQRVRMVPSPGGIKSGKPGWVDTRPAYSTVAVEPRSVKDSLICYCCYGKHHTAPECTLTAREVFKIVLNYEALTEEERDRVPANAYWNAKSWTLADRA